MGSLANRNFDFACLLECLQNSVIVIHWRMADENESVNTHNDSTSRGKLSQPEECAIYQQNILRDMFIFQSYIIVIAGESIYKKCIGDDTKAATRQSLKCIKNQKIKYVKEGFPIWQI